MSLTSSISQFSPSPLPKFPNNNNASNVPVATVNDSLDDLSSTSSSSQSSLPIGLPADIVIETLVSLVLLCSAVVLSAPALQPIRWHTWAGQIERRGIGSVTDGKASIAMAYRGLEERSGFMDIRVRNLHFV